MEEHVLEEWSQQQHHTTETEQQEQYIKIAAEIITECNQLNFRAYYITVCAVQHNIMKSTEVQTLGAL